METKKFSKAIVILTLCDILTWNIQLKPDLLGFMLWIGMVSTKLFFFLIFLKKFFFTNSFFFQGHPSLRMEIVGHQDCNELISEVPYADISASSHKPWHRKKSCTPDLGDISSSEGWCPKRQTSKN